MSKRVTIVMYHYVRDLGASRYPAIKGLDLAKFRGQLDYILSHYSVITMEELLAAARGGRALPANALLLTFDDGYADHYQNVFPLLRAKGLQGSFFPPAKAILNHAVLDVNKIHFVLASVPKAELLVQEIFAMTDEARGRYGLEDNALYYERFAKPSRFDRAEVIFIKRMLQCELPEALRNVIVDRLFQKYVSADEPAFAQELYMSLDQLRSMKKSGMHIGSHGFDHYWMDSLDPEAQLKQVLLSKDFLSQIGCGAGPWAMCYPYGVHNASLLGILRDQGCALGLTTEVDVADLERDDALTLPRLDTNDLPCDKTAAPNAWTLKVVPGARRPA